MKKFNWKYLQDIIIAAIIMTTFKTILDFEYAVMAGIVMILGNVVYLNSK